MIGFWRKFSALKTCSINVGDFRELRTLLSFDEPLASTLFSSSILWRDRKEVFSSYLLCLLRCRSFLSWRILSNSGSMPGDSGVTDKSDGTYFCISRSFSISKEISWIGFSLSSPDSAIDYRSPLLTFGFFRLGSTFLNKGSEVLS